LQFSARVQFALAFGLLLAVALLTVMPLAGTYRLPAPDAMSYADVARSIVLGEGAMSGRLNPSHVIALSYRQRLPATLAKTPYRQNTGWPLAIAPAFAVFGIEGTSVLWAALFWWLVTGVLVFALGRLCGGPLVGWLALCIYALHPRVIGYALSGLSEPLAQALIVGSIVLLLPREKPGVLPLFAGVLLALAAGIRQVMPFLGLDVIIVMPWFQAKKRWTTLALALVGFAVVMLGWRLAQPWLYPQYDRRAYQWVAPETKPHEQPDYPGWFAALQKVTHNGALAFTDLYPGHRMEGQIELPSPPADEAMAAFWRKTKINLGKIGRTAIVGLGGLPLTLLFWTGLLLAPRREGTQAVKWTTLALLTLTAVMCLPLFVMERYFDFFLPLIAVVVAAVTSPWLQQLNRKQATVAGLTAIVGLLVVTWPTPWMGAINPNWADTAVAEARVDRRESFAEMTALLAHTEPGDAIICDVPWACAWLGDRVCILAPADPADVEALRQRVQARWILLTLQNPMARDAWQTWAQELDEQSPWRFVRGKRLGPTPLLLFEETEPPPPLYPATETTP